MRFAAGHHGHAPPLSRARLPALHGLRWVGAVGVFFYHACGPYMFPPHVFDESVPFALRNVGASALSFFFILTGFVLTWSARPSDTVGRFWWRRLVKLYPNHIVTFVVMIALLDLTSLWSFREGATGIIPALFLVQAWSPDPYVTIGINAVSWSMSVDAFFLLLFPLWLMLLNRIRPARLWSWAVGVVALMVAVPLVATLLPYEPMLPEALIGRPTSAWQWWFVYFSPLTRSLECVLGSIAARLVLHGRWPRMPRYSVVGVAALAYAVGLLFPINFYGIVVWSALPMVLVTVALAQSDMAGRRTLIGHPTMVWFGNISFAFYLIHRIVLEVLIPGLLKDVAWTTWSALGAILLVLLVTTGLAYLLYVGVERPLVRRFSPSDPSGREPDPGGPPRTPRDPAEPASGEPGERVKAPSPG